MARTKFKSQAKLVKHCRIKLGLSLNDVGRRLGRAYQQVNNIETGLAGVPADLCYRWAEILQIDARHIINRVTSDYRREYIRKAKLAITSVSTTE